jgi:hypothetical protein
VIKQDEVVERDRCPRQRSSAGQDAEVALRAEIVFEIRFCVTKRYVMLLEQLVYLETTLELKKAPNLGLRQRTGPIRLNGDHLERAPWNVVPSALERRRHVIR